MTYGKPGIVKAIESFAARGVDGLLVLPLFPQYCGSTTGSVIDGTHRAAQALALCAGFALHQRLSRLPRLQSKP